MSTWFLFDLDGTLTDNSEGILKCVRYALAELNQPDAPDAVLRRFIGPPLHDPFMEYCGFSREEAFRAVDTYRVRYKKLGVYENCLFPGMKEMLEKLCAAGAKLCVATSKPKIFTEEILKQHGIHGLFTYIVGANLDGTLTDKTEVIWEVLRQIGETDEPVYMIGDRSFDIVGAKNCALPSVGVYFGFAEPGELEAAGADYVVDTVAQLETQLLNLI